MPGNDLTLLLDAARLAGEIAVPYWGQSPETWEKEDGAGPVTEADLAVNNKLRDVLTSARPDYGWLSEESEDNTDRLNHDRVFIVDPIDGTRSFIAGEKTWAHSLAIAQNGQIVAGVIFLPLLDKMYTARTGKGARLNGNQIRSSDRTQLDGATVLAARSNFDPEHWIAKAPPVNRQFRPSLAYRMALVAEGRFDAMLTLRNTWEWDVAAGALIASEAGAQVSDRFGAAPIFNSKGAALPGMIAGTRHVHNGLREQLA